VVLPIFCILKLGRNWRSRTAGSQEAVQLFSRWGSAAIAVAGAAYLVAALRAW
jgi:hypothetical protein